MATGPIASVARLRELGLDPSEYGSCSEPVQKSVKNKGRVWVNRGCGQYNFGDHGCPWRASTEHMQPRDETDTNPRPRNVITKFIKPNDAGPGDKVNNSYCSCVRFLGGLKRRDGRNGEIAEAVGGEGEAVLIKTSERKTNPDNSVYFKPRVESVTVPRFPDPTEVDELFEDVYAGQDRLAHKAKTVDAERERRMGGAVKREQGVSITTVDPRSA
jgi:hypothetical protein